MGLTYRTQILSSWRNLKPAMTSLPARWQPWRHCCCLEQHNMGTMIKTSHSVRSLKNTTSSVVNAVVHHAHIKHIKHGDNCVRICSVIDLLLKRRISEHLRGSHEPITVLAVPILYLQPLWGTMFHKVSRLRGVR